MQIKITLSFHLTTVRNEIHSQMWNQKDLIALEEAWRGDVLQWDLSTGMACLENPGEGVGENELA